MSRYAGNSRVFSRTFARCTAPIVTRRLTEGMRTAYPLPSGLSQETVANTASLLRIVALILISGAAIASRLFAVVNFESIIHEL